jgi:hypothetical protein
MSKAVIQELRPKTPIEWILADELVDAQFSAMRYRTWQAAVMQFSVAEGLTRAVKNRLRSGKEGSEADLDWKGKKLLGSMRPNDHAIEAEMYLSRRSDMDSIHKRQLSCSTSPRFIVASVGAEAKPSAKGGRANRESSH